jgi:hypothetical protein
MAMVDGPFSAIPEDLPEYPIYIWNLSYKLEDEDLRALFGRTGDIASCQMFRAPTGRKTGAAIVNYRHKSGAVRAIHEFGEMYLHGRTMHLEWGKDIAAKYLDEHKAPAAHKRPPKALPFRAPPGFPPQGQFAPPPPYLPPAYAAPAYAPPAGAYDPAWYGGAPPAYGAYGGAPYAPPYPAPFPAYPPPPYGAAPPPYSAQPQYPPADPRREAPQ